MANKVVIFPVTKLAEAEAYAAACNLHYASNFEAGGVFAYIRPDNLGQHVVPLYGPPWMHDQTPFVEPPECAALRVDGVIHNEAIWPDDDNPVY